MGQSLRRLLFAAFWLCLFWLPSQALADNRALLIGCDRFVTQEDTTPVSAQNVGQLARTLASSALNLDTLVTRREGVATVAELAELIQDAFGEAQEGDVSYFYISTHGLWSQGMSNADMTLVLSDGKREEGLTAWQLRALFDQVPGVKVLILDACHAGAVIGKGVYDSFVNVFEGPDYKVLCSSGGAEESWLWSAVGVSQPLITGAGYFSGALVTGMSSVGGFAADDNRDGQITLTELRRYLRLHHGASTVQVYPEEDDFPILTYDAESYNERLRESSLENVVFEDGVLSADQPSVNFSFTVLRDVQVGYLLVYQRDGRWDFAGARFIWDNAERFGPYGDAQGYLTPGYKERAITLDVDAQDDTGYGYALLHVTTVRDGQVSVMASRLLCITPTQGDPLLSLSCEDSFCPEMGDELTMVVRHQIPCELTVQIETADGTVVRRLASRQGTRPEQLSPRGSTFTWTGKNARGEICEQGEYWVRVLAYIGEDAYEMLSGPFLLLTPDG